jgi:PAS domain S-box-containing protein
LKTSTAGVSGLIENQQVLNILEEVRKSYPFTFIGKSKIRKLTDNLEEFFWIKNVQGIFVLVNKNVSYTLGLNAVQIEGKPESNFIPPYLVNFQQSIDQYIIESANCVVLHDARFKTRLDVDEYETVEIPLLNSSNEIVAIIGIGQKRSPEKNEPELINVFKNTFDGISLAVAFIDDSNQIKYCNSEFINLYNISGGSEQIKYFKVFPAQLSERISSFINSTSVENKFEFKNEDNFNLTLKKFYKGNIYKGILISIEKNLPVKEIPDNPVDNTYKDLLRNNPFPAFIINNQDLKFLDINDEALKLYGYTAEEFLSMDLTDLYTQEEMQSLLDLTAENINEGIFYGPFNQKKKDNSNLFVKISRTNITYKGLESSLVIINDISEKIKLEKNINLYKSVFEHTSSLIFITDAAGFITFVNNKVTEALFFTNKDLEKTSFAALFTTEQRAYVNSEIFNSGSSGIRSFNTRIKNAEDKFFECQLKVIPALNVKGEIDSFLILVELEKEKVETLQKKTASSSEVESGFLLENAELTGNIFHEILTPINVILGFVQELTGSIEKPTSEQKEAAEIIEQNRINLLNIMNAVIDYISVSEEGVELDVEEIKITDMIEDLQRDFKNLNIKKDVQLSYGRISSSLIFQSDRIRFQNLISLVLMISAKISGEDKIYISAYQINEDEFIFIIKNNAYFTSGGLIENLRNTTRGELTAGDLGISKFTSLIVKKLLELLGGKPKVIDENKNLEFGIIFPLSLIPQKSNIGPGIINKEQNEKGNENLDIPEELPVEKNFNEFKEKLNHNLNIKPSKQLQESEVLVDDIHLKHLKEADLFKMKCLCIEDSVDSQMLFKNQMKGLKEIKYASCFEEALPLLQTTKFDFIVLDINLQGDYNGIDALKFIRRIPGYERTPIIAASAYLLPGDGEKFIAAGFDDFISKPIFYDNMVESLNKLF